MNLPTLYEWLNRFEFLRGYPAAFLVVLSALVIVLAWEWRLKLLALAGQYMIAGFLYIDILEPRLANVKVLTGLFVCLILTITAGQVNWGRLPEDVPEEEAAGLEKESRIRLGPFLLPTTFLYRLFLAALMLLVVWVISPRAAFQLPAMPADLPHISFAVYTLMGMGLLALSLTSEPLHAGAGIFMFLTGFELYYSLLVQSVTMLAALAAINLVIALAVSRLTQTRHAVSSHLKDRAGAVD